MKNIICTLLMSLLVGKSFSQIKTLSINNPQGIILKTHPVALINPDKPSLILGIEKVLRKKIELELGFGIRYLNGLLDGNLIPDTSIVKFKGHTQYAHLTLYNLNSSPIYIGFTYRRFYDLMNRQKLYFPTSSTTNTSDSYAVKRNVNIFAFRIGSFISISKLMSIEPYGEIGIRHRTVELINNEFDPFISSFSHGIFPWEKPFTGIYPSLNLGLKVNFTLKN